MNPFILAGLVFGAIGLIQEAMTANEDKKKSTVVKPKDDIVPAKAGDTIVNVGGAKVETAAQKVAAVKKAAEKKADEKKPKETPPSDG